MNELDPRRCWRITLPLSEWQAVFDAMYALAESALFTAKVVKTTYDDSEMTAESLGLARKATRVMEFIQDMDAEWVKTGDSKIFRPADDTYRKQLRSEQEEQKRRVC